MRMTIAVYLMSFALVGCGSDPVDVEPANATATRLLFLNVFNPCREMPKDFLAKHEFVGEPGPSEYELEPDFYLGCNYESKDYFFTVRVSNGRIGSAGSAGRRAYRPTTVAGRNAIILVGENSAEFCRVFIAMTGGHLLLDVTSYIMSLDKCETLRDLAEELVPLLPPGV